jgi:hypothetical protein
MFFTEPEIAPAAKAGQRLPAFTTLSAENPMASSFPVFLISQ